MRCKDAEAQAAQSSVTLRTCATHRALRVTITQSSAPSAPTSLRSRAAGRAAHPQLQDVSRRGATKKLAVPAASDQPCRPTSLVCCFFSLLLSFSFSPPACRHATPRDLIRQLRSNGRHFAPGVRLGRLGGQGRTWGGPAGARSRRWGRSPRGCRPHRRRCSRRPAEQPLQPLLYLSRLLRILSLRLKIAGAALGRLSKRRMDADFACPDGAAAGH